MSALSKSSPSDRKGGKVQRRGREGQLTMEDRSKEGICAQNKGLSVPLAGRRDAGSGNRMHVRLRSWLDSRVGVGWGENPRDSTFLRVHSLLQPDPTPTSPSFRPLREERAETSPTESASGFELCPTVVTVVTRTCPSAAAEGGLLLRLMRDEHRFGMKRRNDRRFVRWREEPPVSLECCVAVDGSAGMVGDVRAAARLARRCTTVPWEGTADSRDSFAPQVVDVEKAQIIAYPNWIQGRMDQEDGVDAAVDALTSVFDDEGGLSPHEGGVASECGGMGGVPTGKGEGWETVGEGGEGVGEWLARL
ncbi:hypothetical protein FKP32DRAFT_1604733 [Trametes sanguinea]|nr:hypothetical protein FKP32DRAFT_1604733 [Trametes sanguinea]